jgi:hypothetical protein
VISLCGVISIAGGLLSAVVVSKALQHQTAFNVNWKFSTSN